MLGSLQASTSDSATEDGQVLGRSVAEYVLEHAVQPVGH